MAWRSSPEAPVGATRWDHIGKPTLRLVVCIAAVFAVTAILYAVPLIRRPLTAVLTFLFVVQIVSATWGFRYALFVSFLAALGFSWLLPPVGRFWLSDSRDVFVLVAFLVIGITTSRLSDRARREALNANQRRAEAVAAQQRFADLVNSVEGIVWEADAQTFAFSFISEQAERILGYPAEQWLREPTFWKDHLHPEDRDSAVQFCVQATAEKRSHDFEYRMIAADGRAVWLRNLVTMMGENGRASQLRGVMIDITKRKQDEQTLREREARIRRLVDANIVGIFFWDFDGGILDANDEFLRMVGYDRDDLASGRLRWTDLTPADWSEQDARLVQEHRKTGRLEPFEKEYFRKDGGRVPVLIGNASFEENTNQGVAFVLDLTERKRAEQARQDIEEQWKAAFESNPTMYFMVDAAGAIVSVNAFGAGQLGYTVSELVGQSVLNVFYEPDRDAIRKHATECFEQPGRTMRWEARKIRKDGTMLWVRETANAVLLRNRPVILVVCEDITDQKRAEEAARRSEKELRDVIETIPAMAFSIRPDGSTEFVNRRVLEYTGLSEETISGPGWQSTVHKDDFERHMNKWRASMASDQPFENEARHRSANGEYRWFLVRAVPQRDEHGNILKWYGILTDIEDRKRAEALLTGEKQILEMVAKGDSLPQILDNLCRLVEEQTSGALASILLLDGNCLRHGGAPSLPKAYTDAIDGAVIGPSVGSCGTAAYRGEQVIVEDIATDTLWADYRGAALPHSLRACWSTPVFSTQGKVIATFAMYYREPRRPSLRDQEIIEQITHLAGVAIERKLTQEALRRSEAYLTEAQRLTRTGSWAYNPFTGKAIYWSEEMFRIFELDPQQGPPTSETFRERVHPEDRDSVYELIRKAALEKTEYEHNHRIVLPDGTVKHIHAIGHPVLNRAGDVAEFAGSAVDVTEGKQAEEALRRSEAYLAEAQRLSHTGSWAWDPRSDRMVYCSEEIYRIFGVDPQEHVPSIEVLLRRVHPEDRDRVRAESVGGSSGKGDHAIECRLLLPDGTIKHVLSMRHPSFDGARELVEIIGTIVDVTERKRAEEERERLRQLEADLAHMNRVSMMGELAASLAHEIKQPIAAAITNANTSLRWLARVEPNLQEAREAIMRIVKDGTRAAEIINRLRSFYEKGAPPQPELIDLNELAREMLMLLHNEANRYSISMDTELAPELPRVIADRVQLQQVFMNLMLNAIEAMKETAGELTIKSQLANDGQLLMSVSDTGVGLPADKADEIFNAFFTTKPQGTGMGLAITRSIIEAHGGRLWASANTSRGATFYFTLPSEATASSTSAA